MNTTSHIFQIFWWWFYRYLFRKCLESTSEDVHSVNYLIKFQARPYILNYTLPYTFSKTWPSRQFYIQIINKSTRTRCKIYSKLTIKTPERRHWFRSGVFIVNFEHISYIVLNVFIVNFEEVNGTWGGETCLK